MEMVFCPNCNKLTGYKRVIGFGTFFAVLLTAGLWLLTLPFYPKRCITCGVSKSDSVPWYRTWRRPKKRADSAVLLVPRRLGRFRRNAHRVGARCHFSIRLTSAIPPKSYLVFFSRFLVAAALERLPHASLGSTLDTTGLTVPRTKGQGP